MKISLDTLGQNLDGPGLCEARRTFYQQVAITQQGDQHAVNKV